MLVIWRMDRLLDFECNLITLNWEEWTFNGTFKKRNFFHNIKLFSFTKYLVSLAIYNIIEKKRMTKWFQISINLKGNIRYGEYSSSYLLMSLNVHMCHFLSVHFCHSSYLSTSYLSTFVNLYLSTSPTSYLATISYYAI